MGSTGKKISFKVSARTARLIGRENVATANGAVTELVKNAYDADARMCAICFLQKYNKVPIELNSDEYDYLENIHPEITNYFNRTEQSYHLVEGLTETERSDLDRMFKGIVDLWIVDNGSGMSSKIIEDQWMVIGTNAKENRTKSASGRILTGAKGIGRFALDRLGAKSELYSSMGNELGLVHWSVNWNAFEGKERTLDEIEADLNTIYQTYSDLIAEMELEQILPKTIPNPDFGPNELIYKSGTIIRLQHLRDNWHNGNIEKLRSTLETLLPPKERSDFNIYVFDHRDAENCGWIDNLPPDHYDYRLQASIKVDGKIDIRLDRKEIDTASINPIFYDLDGIKGSGITEANFRNGVHTYETSIDKILNAEGSRDISEAKSIGPFEFTMYYIKLSNPTKSNLKKYPQRRFDAAKRRQWMKLFGGVRIYRDGFRVRPYGEPGTPNFDWLLLGERTAQNPTAVSSNKGHWPVPPQQVAGTIHISKKNNPSLADQSNREGIMNEHSLLAFRQIIVGIIREFEKDRNRIHHNLKLAFDKENPTDDKKKDALKYSKIILNQIRNKDNSSIEQELNDPKQVRILAEAVESYNENEKNLNEEIKVLRGLATLGTVLVSFTHELKQIMINMNARQRRMKKSLKMVVDSNRLNSIPLELSPYDLLERWERENQKVSRWIEIALSSVKRSKRRRKSIKWPNYFIDLSQYWNNILLDREISFNVPGNLDSNLSVLAHEIDLDSVFFNLIVNSTEVLTLPSQNMNRKIEINLLSFDEKEVVFEYADNGPGIPDVFKTAADIFNFGETSKPELPGQQIEGTGIGMAIVKEVVDDYGGNVCIMSPLGGPGFRLKMSWPRK